MPLTKTGNLVFESNIVKRPIKVRPSINIGGPENLAYNKAYNNYKMGMYAKRLATAGMLGLAGYGVYKTLKDINADPKVKLNDNKDRK